MALNKSKHAYEQWPDFQLEVWNVHRLAGPNTISWPIGDLLQVRLYV